MTKPYIVTTNILSSMAGDTEFVVYLHEAFQSSLPFSISLGLLLFPPNLLLLLVCFFVSINPVFVWLQPVMHITWHWLCYGDIRYY